MKKSFILLVTLLSAWFATAQDCKYYEVLMQKANQLWAEGKFEQALNQLTAAREHCPAKSAMVDAQFVAFTKKIAQKYREAEVERIRAEKETARADRSALINRMGALALQKSKTNDYSLAWHMAVQAYQYAYDSLEGRCTELVVNGIMHDIISDPTTWLYKPIGRSNEEIKSAIFSPDAQYIITYALNSIDLWDKNGQLLKTLESGEGLGEPVFSPDGEFLLTFGNNTVHLWDKSTSLIQSSEVNEPVRKALFSPDGQSIFIIGTKAVHVWDKSGRPIQALERSAGIEHFTFSPDGHMLTWKENDNLLQLRDKIGKIILTLETAEPIQGAIFFPGCPENPNGKHYILAMNAGAVNLWDEKGQQIKTLSEQQNYEKTVLSPDGQLMLNWEKGGFPQLCDKNGQLIKLLGDSIIRITGAEFSPDGQLILTWNSDEVWIWNKTGQLIQNFNTGGIINAASFFSLCTDTPKGAQYILTIGYNHVGIWGQDGKLIKVVTDKWMTAPPLFSKDGALGLVFFYEEQGHGNDYHFAFLFKNGKFFETLGGVQNAILFPDGQSFLAISTEGSADLRDIEGKHLSTFESIYKGVFSPACPENPQGGQYLLTTFGGKARLWRKNAQALQTFSNVSEVTFSPPNSKDPAGGQYMLTTGEGKAKLWNKTGQLIQALKADNTITAAGFSADGQRLSTQGEQQAQLWDSSGQLIKTFGNPENSAGLAAKFSPDGQQILTLGRNELQLWDAQGHLIKTLQSSTSKTDAVFSPDGQRILTYGDSTVSLWTKNGQMLRVLESGAGLNIPIFSPNSAYILTSWGRDRTVFNEQTNPDVKLWDKNGQLIKQFDAGTSGIYEITFSPDGQSILGGSYDGMDRLWNIQGQLINKIELSPSGPVEFAPDGRFFFSNIYTTRASWIEPYDRTGQKINIFDGYTEEYGLGHGMDSPVFSPDDQSILTTNRKTAQLWDKTGTVLKKLLEGHTGDVRGAIFSPACPADPKGGQFILTWGEDQTTRLWDKSGQPLRTIYGPVRTAQFSPDGQLIVIEGSNSLQLWEGLPQYIRSHTQLGAIELLQAGAVLDTRLLLEQKTPAELAEIGEVYLKLQDLTNANLFFTQSDQRQTSPEALMGLFKVARQSGRVFNFRRFLSSENATTLRQYGDLLYQTARLSSNYSNESTSFDTTLAQIVVQLYEKAERLAHSPETLIRLYSIGRKSNQPFDVQRFFASQNAAELRQYGNYFFNILDPVSRGVFALTDENKLLLKIATQLYEKAEQLDHQADILIRLHKIAQETKQPFDVQRFFQTENPDVLWEYGRYFLSALQKIQSKILEIQSRIPATYNPSPYTAVTPSYEQPSAYNVAPPPLVPVPFTPPPNVAVSPGSNQTTFYSVDPHSFLEIATQLLEKAERIKHSTQTLLDLQSIADMSLNHSKYFQQFLASNDANELREYADFFSSQNNRRYILNIPYAKNAVSLGEKMLGLHSDPASKSAVARYYAWLGHCQLFVPDGAGAEASLQSAQALNPFLAELPLYLAPALLLQGHYAEAEKMYLEYQSKSFKYRDYKTFFLEDFDTLEAQGVNHPDIARIRARLEDKKE